MDERTPAPGESYATPGNVPGSVGNPSHGESEGIESSWSSESSGSFGRGEARRVGGAARGRLMREADKRKSRLADRIDHFAESLEGRELDGPEGQLLGSVARFAHGASGQIRDRSSEQLFSDLEEAMRQRPGAFIAGCLALGFIGGRLLRG